MKAGRTSLGLNGVGGVGMRVENGLKKKIETLPSTMDIRVCSSRVILNKRESLRFTRRLRAGERYS